MICLIMILSAALGISEAIMVLSGASSPEDLDENTVEKFEHYATHRIHINSCNRSKLLSCGLFSAYQVASLLDYISRHGDILSWSELATVHGFPSRRVEALKYFISLESGRTIAARAPDSLVIRYSLTAKAAVRAERGTPPLIAAGGKVQVEFGDIGEFNWASRTTWSEQQFRPGNFSAALYGRRWLGKLVLGCFNARYGEGLGLWSGMTMSGYPTVQSMSRNGSGLSPSHSYSEGLCGIGAEIEAGRWTIGVAYDHKGKAIASVHRLGRISQLGAYGWIDKKGYGAFANWKFGLDGASLFGEAGYDGKPKALAGIMAVPRYGWKVGALAKYLGNSAEAAAGISAPFINATTEAKYEFGTGKQRYKASAKVFHDHKLSGMVIRPEARIVETLSPGNSPILKSDLRADIDVSLGRWAFHVRGNVVRGKATAWLCYAEAGYKGEFRLFLRGGLFRIDNWDDRIYVYERDAPGNFNVPAYYGRGCNLSLFAGWKGLYLRAACTAYPWMRGKPDRLEVKLQYKLDL